MRGFIGNTEYAWFTQLRAIEPPIDEVNFWKPGTASFKILRPGEPVLFRLKAPRNAIAGFGTFVHATLIEVCRAEDRALQMADGSGSAAAVVR